MSKFYYDCEFLEGTQKKLFGHTKPTIDLISIGIVSEDDREYYVISKDFNLKEAWNRYQLEQQSGDMRNQHPEGKKVYWIRENVLKPIYKELRIKELNEQYGDVSDMECYFRDRKYFKQLKRLIKKYGKSNKQIAAEIVEFVYGKEDDNLTGLSQLETAKKYESSDKSKNPVFYAYYGAYDHVALCWLFGKMIDLPKGFPMYSIDLKQMLDEQALNMSIELCKEINSMVHPNCTHNVYEHLYSVGGIKNRLGILKEHHDYPTQQNAHNALDDARFNKKLHEFIQSL